ncbi:hypothetical protein ACP6H4_23880 [Vibrio harveyi]|uniref:hypothetical protein n=1 Tax=Vibrio harveyi group TaxID=717610 RepID=UPI00215D371A|nr:hypothetical protein [Vibrio parahaemolyticus]MCR9837365.1 hypothetical protein [Vibrio parahaemolyticus]
MGMKDGIKDMVFSALDTKDDLAFELIENDIDPITAIKVSTILTKQAVLDKLDQKLSNRNAAHITHNISQSKGKNLLN